MTGFDVIVVGLGATGAATLMELARRGTRVLGMDAHTPPHTLASHHGESRIIRLAYYEHPSYVPLLKRAYVLWRELERATGRSLMLQTGGLMIGSESTELVAGVLASAREHRLAHTVLDAPRMAERYPMFHLDASMVGVHEPDAGILFPERCVATFVEVAKSHGATVRCDTPVRAWSATASGVAVETGSERFEGSSLVIAAGPGTPALLPDMQGHLTIERQVVVHMHAAAHPEWFMPDRMPIFCLQEDDTSFFYGIPDLGRGLKAGQHHAGALGPYEAVDRSVHDADLAVVQRYLARRMPEANGRVASGTVCVYTDSPDGHFLIDRLPGAGNVIVASVCSGHGFKFATVAGEVVADLALGRRPGYDLSMLSAARF